MRTKEIGFILKRFDWFIISLPIIITSLGILTIYSATRPVLDTPHPYFYIKQTLWLGVSIIVMLFSSLIDYTLLRRYSYYIYGVGIILLCITLLAGHSGMGAQRWLRFGPVGFQPSEVFRIILIIGLSSTISKAETPLAEKSIAKIVILYIAIPFIVLFLQPDLGTAVLLSTVTAILSLIKGIRKRVMLLGIIMLLLIPLFGEKVWNGLKDYQKKRLIAFVSPEIDPKGIGYQIEQSKVAIGSGKLTGKGYLKGTQGPLRFLPERHTDFAFAVFAEEWGFVGVIILLSLYLLIIIRGLETAYYAKDQFGFFLCTGISVMFLLYFTVNIGMTMGLMPVVGVPLPFFSYGGTALVSNFMAIGILNNVRLQRFELSF